MTTIRQIDRLWNANDHRRLICEISAAKPELVAVAQRLLGPVAAAAVAIIRLEELGQSHQPVASRMIRFLLREQQEDGGWGELAVTVLAIRALRCCGGAGAAIERGIDHLRSVQREEGAWPYEAVRRLPADALTTAFVVVNLSDDPVAAGRLDLVAAAAWLRNNLDEMEISTRRLAERALSRIKRRPQTLFNAPAWS